MHDFFLFMVNFRGKKTISHWKSDWYLEERRIAESTNCAIEKLSTKPYEKEGEFKLYWAQTGLLCQVTVNFRDIVIDKKQ